MSGLTITTDFPPSQNSYFATFKNRRIISRQGREFRQRVHAQLADALPNHKPLEGRLRVAVQLSRYDKRKYDVQNYLKCLLDCFNGIVWVDDGQIDEVHVNRLPVSKTGYAQVLIEEL